MKAVRVPRGLARNSMTGPGLWFFAVGASAPMTVLAGGIVATFAATGVVAVPAAFAVLTVLLLLFAVGYVAVSRYLGHAGVLYALPTAGLGRPVGVAAAAVALLSYNAIQVALYGLIGSLLADLGRYLVVWPWWGWALLVWAVIAALGVLRIRVNATVLAVVLLTEIAVVLVFDLLAFANAAEPVSLAPLWPGGLFTDGVGGVFALSVAAFVGCELAPVYGEEARHHRAVARATLAAFVFTGLLYTVSAWAMTAVLGAGNVAAAEQAGMPIATLIDHGGLLLGALGSLLLLTSVFGAMLSFHHTVARYVFALARDRLLPARWGHVGTGTTSGAPIGGSLVQSGVALAVVIVFAAGGLDPVGALFVGAATLAATGLLGLMAVASLAVVMFFARNSHTIGQPGTPLRHGHHRGEAGEGMWQRLVAPALAAVGLVTVLTTVVNNTHSLLGVAPDAPVTWLLPASVAATAAAGLVWALLVAALRPRVYRNLGQRPDPLRVVDDLDIKV